HAAEQLLEAVRAAARRDPVIDSAVAARVFPRFAEDPGPGGKCPALNGSQVQLLGLLGRSWSGLRIASELGLPEATVRSCLNDLLRRMGVASPAEALVSSLRHGLIRPEQIDWDGGGSSFLAETPPAALPGLGIA
ncbi:MAG: helix-turn-helix transcriptional regulator, partial [Dehalococcoidia bacterium]